MDKQITNKFYPFPSTKNSFVFSFEGGDGTGKSTQIQLASEYLEKKGFDVLLLREPGGTELGEKIRTLILKSPIKRSAHSNLLLFLASRSQLITEKILPFIQEPGRVVLLDRYIDSSLAYQGVGEDLGIETVLSMHAHPPLHFLPHKTFLLHLDAKQAILRRKGRQEELDQYEIKGREFAEKTLKGYFECQKLFSERIKTIEADKTPEEIFQKIIPHLPS